MRMIRSRPSRLKRTKGRRMREPPKTRMSQARQRAATRMSRRKARTPIRLIPVPQLRRRMKRPLMIGARRSTLTMTVLKMGMRRHYRILMKMMSL